MLLETCQRPKQLISLTPLIDVVFILLLFFMLSSTFNRTKQLEINAAASTSVPKESQTIRILINEPGHVLINGTVHTLNSSSLSDQLKNFAVSGEKVYLAARSRIKVQEIILLIDLAKKSGISNLSLSESVQP